MSIASIFIHASSIMTVISFLTFVGILGWAYTPSRRAYFDDAAWLPLADELDGVSGPAVQEAHHG